MGTTTKRVPLRWHRPRGHCVVAVHSYVSTYGAGRTYDPSLFANSRFTLFRSLSILLRACACLPCHPVCNSRTGWLAAPPTQPCSDFDYGDSFARIEQDPQKGRRSSIACAPLVL